MAAALLPITLVLVAVSVVGAALPLFRSWSQRGLHLFVSVSAGIFLGIVFLHLLPELAAGAAHAAPGETVTLLPWAAALGGLVLLFFIEKIWLVGHGPRDEDHGHAHAPAHAHAAEPADHEHDVVWFATFIGLTVHSFATGLGYSGVAADPKLLWPFLGSIAVHQASESFSLATVMRLAGLTTSRALLPLTIYCIATPIGLLAGAQFTVPGGVSPLLTGLACGTFLYVAVGNLLPEVFHGTDHRLPRVGGLLLGLLVACIGVASLR